MGEDELETEDGFEGVGKEKVKGKEKVEEYEKSDYGLGNLFSSGLFCFVQKTRRHKKIVILLLILGRSSKDVPWGTP